MKVFGKVLGAVILAVVIGFALVACPTPDGGGGNGGGPNTGGGIPKTGGVVGKTSTGTNLIRMDAAMLDSKLTSITNYGSYESTLTFENLEAKYMPAAGDIICAGPATNAPYGFLYKVKTVATEGEKTVITTEMTTLEDAVDEANLAVFNFALDLEGGEEEEIEGVTVEYGYFDDGETDVDEPAYGYSANARSMLMAASSTEQPLEKKASRITVDKPELSGKVRLTGSVQLGVTMDCVVKIDSFHMQKFELSTTPRIKADLELTVSGKIEETITILIHKKKLAPITYMAGPVPVVFVPEITIKCLITMEGEIELQVQKLASWDYSYVYGIRYLKGGKLDTFSRNTSKPAEFLKDPQLTLKGEVKLEPNVGLMFGLYGVAYAGLSIGPYGKLAGEVGISESLLNGKLEFYFGVDLGVNAKLEILGHQIGEELSKTFLSLEVLIWERNGAIVYSRDTWNAVILGIKNGGNNKNYTIFVTGGFVMPGGIADTFGSVTGLNVTITGNKTITLTGQGSLLQIGAGQTVVIRDTDFKGHSANNRSLINVRAKASLTLEGNSSVSNNTTTNNTNSGGAGGGIATDNESFLTMKDNASVNDNTASDGGGGVLVSGTFNMMGGTISGNTTASGGGGGGGLYLNDSAIFNMTGGTISGNTVTGTYGRGGGVYVYGYNPVLRMATGTIYGSNGGSNANKAPTSGAALYVFSSGANVQHGTFIGYDTWSKKGDLSTTNDTIRVANGVLQ